MVWVLLLVVLAVWTVFCEEQLQRRLKCKYHHWSSPGYSVWILTSRGHERFVKSSSQLWHCEPHFFVSREGRQFQWCVSRIFTICGGKSRVKDHKVRTMSKRRLNFQACIGKPLFHRYGHLCEEGDHQRRQNLDFHSWTTNARKVWRPDLRLELKFLVHGGKMYKIVVWLSTSSRVS